MSDLLKQLLIVQDRDRHIVQLEQELRDLPARREMIEGRMHDHEAALKSAEDDLMKKQSEIKQLDVEVESLRDKIQRFRQQQFEIKSNEGYRTLVHEIGEHEKKIRAIEDRELDRMEELEVLKAAVTERQVDLKREQESVHLEIDRMNARAGEIHQTIETVRAERADLVREVPDDALARYERILKNRGDFAIVSIEKSICGGCHMILPPQTVQDVKKGQALQTCTFCGRMLYYP